MIPKVSLFVSDTKLCSNLCHLFRYRKFYTLPLSLLSSQNCSTQLLINYKYISVRLSVTHLSNKMSAKTSSLVSFDGKEDRYEGITVLSNYEPCDLSEFSVRLKNSLESWRNNKKRAIWFKVHVDQCEWVPILVKNGFKYHHAKEEYVMLYLWLPTHESNNLPIYAHTMVGVGAVVENERNQVLVVKEKYFYKVPMWKLPGGYVEPGENLVDAAIREVAEETGIQAEFKSVLNLRHTHHGMFGCSDIYVVVNLKALGEDIQKCEREIAECQWMDIEDYLKHPHIHELNRFFLTKLLFHKKHNLKMDCYHGIHQVMQKPYTVYSIVKTDDEESIQIPGPIEVGETSKSS